MPSPPQAKTPRRGQRLRLAKLALAGLVLLALASALALATIDRWLFRVLDPGPFDAAASPPAPDYDDPAAWAALPERRDGADLALPELPAIDQIDQAAAPVDVFYLHPTTWLGSEWNAPIDDPEIVAATTRGATSIQASAFNACCAVHAPRYRQANGQAFTHPSAQGGQAIDLAYADLSAAFDHFLARTDGRPFILAGHSQGAILGARLLRERIAAQPDLRARLVAAYLPGAALRQGSVADLAICASPTQTGCVISWNARGPRFQPNAFELDAEDPDTMRGRVCVNPISWTLDGAHVPAQQNAGAVFFDTKDPALLPHFADAQCVDGTLVVTELGELERDFMSALLLWAMGPEDYHPIDIQLFYVDLRNNARARVDAFLATRPGEG
ncbi:DUF3089 domain-containing protein [Pseudenhygromyxa sp. WMMC2535]|uniref:DUF3089 domain-containing protein n=1 Tax=Pseudenhygromyxa sp. WMMC2535 TaxID=2712867 RepID=UPI0015573EC9|nr:DUF3089 domain-containing protein [Pseudenhygromyxa sp. WMMC2535]NVB37206.1 DUF3089 domain-containing protein [Pseudenhygromyxa sp. WMMC2535]